MSSRCQVREKDGIESLAGGTGRGVTRRLKSSRTRSEVVVGAVVAVRRAVERARSRGEK